MNDDDQEFEELNHFDDYYTILNVSKQVSAGRRFIPF